MCAPPEKSDTVAVCCDSPHVWIGIGAAYTPMDRMVPFFEAQWGPKRLRIFGQAGYSFYHQNRSFANENLNVVYRYIFGGIIWHPPWRSTISLIAAWQRSEAYSTYYGKYARKLEGPLAGIRLELGKHVAITGAWTPSEESLRGRDKVEWDYGRFYLSASVFTSILGGK